MSTKSRKAAKTTYRAKVAEIVVSHQPIDSVICLAVWIGSMHRSVTAPYPSGYVLAAGRLRPRRKPKRKLFYTKRVTYFARKVKHKKPEKCLFYWIFCYLSSTESEVSSTAYSSSSSSYSRCFFTIRMTISPPIHSTAPPMNSTS